MRIFIAFLLLWFSSALCCQTLYPGDIAVLGISANTFDCGGPSGGDEISFVCFKDIYTGTVIDVTDNGWERCQPDFWGDTEGVIRFTRTGGNIQAGTVITFRLSNTGSFGTYNFISPDNGWLVENLNTGTPPATALNLNSGGDQLYFMNGGAWNNAGGPGGDDATYSGSILFGFNTKTVWQPDCNGPAPTQNSALHPEVTPCFHMEPAAATDFAKYTGPLTPASTLVWIDRLRTAANWSSYPDCITYNAAQPTYANGFFFQILPTQVGIDLNIPAVCAYDTVLLELQLPPVGNPYEVLFTDGQTNYTVGGLSDGDPLPVAPVQPASYAILGVTDANGCAIRFEFSLDFTLSDVYPVDTTYITEGTCITANTGVFVENYTNQTGCDSVVIREVVYDAPNCAVQAFVTALGPSCTGLSDGSLGITVLSGFLPVQYVWANQLTGTSGSGSVTTLNTTTTVNGLEIGPYKITFTDVSGVTAVFSGTITDPPELEGIISITTNYNGYSVSCADAFDGRAVVNVSGGTPGYNYLWSNGDVSPLTDSLSAGKYQLTVTDGRGCILKLAVLLDAPKPIVSQITARGEKCLGEDSGEIHVLDITGGVEPYLLSLEGQPYSAQRDWVDLPPGQYFLTIQDANACEKLEGIVLPTGLEFTFDAGPDTAILSGDTVLIHLATNMAVDTMIWTPAAYAHPVSNEDALVYPYFSTEFLISAYDTNGCLAVDRIYIDVSRTRNIYFPNVLLPAADLSENRSFTAYAGAGILEVELLQVYNRFGKLVFENRHFPVGQPAAGWQGRAGDHEADPGVYFWHAEIRFTDGRLEKFQGDVTLLR